jgi:hypothetical protein
MCHGKIVLLDSFVGFLGQAIASGPTVNLAVTAEEPRMI